jgi:hypothetical protein
LSAAERSSRERQRELRRSTGFAGDAYERAHNVVWELLQRRLPHIACELGGHLVAANGDYNFQGNERLAAWMKKSSRTLRRARRILEDAGLIKSYLLMPGEMVPGQRSPVLRPQVVRDVRALVALVENERSAAQRVTTSKRGRRTRQDPSDRAGASVLKAPPVPPVRTAADFETLAAMAISPEWSQYFTGIAAGMRKESVPPVKREAPTKPPAPLSPQELDELEAETERLEDELRQRQQRERGPPS